MKSLAQKVLPILVGVALVGLGGVFAYRQFVYYPAALQKTGPSQLSIDFTIEKGESPKAVAARLKAIGVVADDWALLNYLKDNNLDAKIQAGHFQFRGGETIPAVAQILQAGEAAQVSLTVLEGWNSAEIDAKLVSLGLIKSGDFQNFVRSGGAGIADQEGFAAKRGVASLEGYLFPATYKIDPSNFSVQDLTRKMLAAMSRTLAELDWDAAKSPKTLHEVLTLASIVELEEPSEANRPKVADILWRRLENGMGLYADSTLFYVLGHKKNLTTEDFAIDSPYNTRKYRDLPPTPVCSPSKSAIAAALHPELNDFYYYLHDSEGQIHFAKTLTEHNENKAEFLQ
ncbi:MAG: endolytic transglycosylase MltG [Patescibacteria group bacterium]